MHAGSWRFEPLDALTHPVGHGPFRARGLAYIGALKYVDARVPGGRAALTATMGNDRATVDFLEQIFVAGSDYDASPLVSLYAAGAKLEGVPLAPLVSELSRKTSEYAVRTMWKAIMHAATPEAMAARLPATFGRFFPPCTAEAVSVVPGRMVCQLRTLAACMDGLYVWSTEGFVAGALEIAGAKRARVEFERAESEGTHAGVPAERVRFIATWA